MSLRTRMLVPALSLLAIVPTSLRANCELRCSCAYAPAPNELARSAAVFLGEVTRIVPRTDTRVGSAIVTVFRSWKGVNTGTVNIDLADSLTRNEWDTWWTAGQRVGVYSSGGSISSTSCDFFPRLHDTLFVFAGRWRSGQLRADTCSIHRGIRAEMSLEELGPGRLLTRPASYRRPVDDSVLVRELLREVRFVATADARVRHDYADLLVTLERRANAVDTPPAAAQVIAEPRAGSAAPAAPQTPEEIVRRLIGMAIEDGVDSSRSDSLARLAYATADQIESPVRRAELRKMFGIVFGDAGGMHRARTLLSVARSDEERITALQLLARTELRRDASLDSALATVARLEAIAPTRVVVELLLELASDATYSRTAIPAWVATLRRAIALSDQVDSTFAGQARLQAVGFTIRSDLRTAIALASAIRSSSVRDRAASMIVRRQVHLDVRGSLDTALVTSPLLRDSLYVLIATQQAAHRDGAAATRTAVRIVAPTLRALAMSEIAAVYDGRNDTPVSQAMLREALSGLDPRADYSTIATKTIPAMIGSGDLASVLTWARAHTGNAGVWARLAVMTALMPCSYGGWTC